MRYFSDKTERTIHLLMEPHELNRLIYNEIKKNYPDFEEKEIELKYDFVEEGSPAYKTGKVKCSIKIVREL
jgi:hypothetical protein